MDRIAGLDNNGLGCIEIVKMVSGTTSLRCYNRMHVWCGRCKQPKIAEVVPILKPGDSEIPTKYKLLSVLAYLSKI